MSSVLRKVYEIAFLVKRGNLTVSKPTSNYVAARIFACAPRRLHADSGAILRGNLLKIGSEVKEVFIFMSDTVFFQNF